MHDMTMQNMGDAGEKENREKEKSLHNIKNQG